MKLWMSGEIMADVADAYRSARSAVVSGVNQRLKLLSLKTDFQEWAVIGIIRPDDLPDYHEIYKADTRRKVLEFRLKIDHSSFGTSDVLHQRMLVIEALKRSVQKMPEFGVEKQDCDQLMKVLDESLPSG